MLAAGNKITSHSGGCPQVVVRVFQYEKKSDPTLNEAAPCGKPYIEWVYSEAARSQQNGH